MQNVEYLTVRQLSQKHPAFTEGGVRKLLFMRNSNGLSAAVVQLGRKLLISESAFMNWVSNQKGGKMEESFLERVRNGGK